MKMKHVLLGAALSALGSVAAAVPVVTSTFDSGTESWLAVNGAVNFHWVATGGQSGGFVRGLDAGEGAVWLFNAPSAYLGDLSAFYGGNLSFYLRQFTTPQPFVTPLPDVKIIGNGMSIVIDAGADPNNSWTLYSVDLAPGAWHLDTLDGALASAADIQAVLSEVMSFRLRAEYSSNRDSDGLDTVVLSAIPEPETCALMLAGLGVVGFAARRRAVTHA
jgi:hypothetical protein